MMNAIDDSSLVKSAQQGDRDAFDQLVERYQRPVYQLTFRMTGNAEDAADLAQEAFLRAYRNLQHFRGDAAFRTWLHRIAVHVCYDGLKQAKRRPAVFSDQEDPEERDSFTEDLMDSGKGVSEIAESNARQALVHQALRQLPLHYRMMLVLYDIQGFSYEDISQMLNMSMGTVKSRINRGRLLLKEILEPDREQLIF